MLLRTERVLLMGLVAGASRNLFFTGKGGVGKTTTAAATAIALADSGKLVLLVSTDPASNLDEVLEVELGSEPRAVPDVPNLFAMNIDPEATAAAYRERMVGPYRGVLPDEAVASIEEQLSGVCTTEIAAFDEFAKLLGSVKGSHDFAHIVFDTAPTGHTLRLLELPAAWTDFLENNVGGTSCLGPLSGLGAQKELYATTRSALADPQLTTIIVVSRPDQGALDEASRASGELAELGITNQRLVLNGIFSTENSNDPIATAFAARCRKALTGIPERLSGMPRTELPLSAGAMLGVDSLRRFLSGAAPEESPPEPSHPASDLPSLDELVEAIEQGGRGVIMTMGKGGVGKTTLAATLAIALAGRGYKVHLTTTDPAAHVTTAAGGNKAGITVGRIDPAAETSAYAAEVMATVGDSLDEKGRALLAEDLRSPCTEEIAVFRAFARTVAQGEDAFVVIDTAPTGHTLLLLDAAEAYHRQVSQSMGDIPEEVKRLLPSLRDPAFTRILVVTLPEATPVHEAQALHRDLQRAGIEPFAWVVNQSLTPHTITDPLLAGRRRNEGRYIDEAENMSPTTYLIPWLADPVAALGSHCLRQ